MATKYYTFSDAKTEKGLNGKIESVDQTNPIFNFEQSFFDKLQGVSTLELARSVPHVSVHTLDLNGEIIEDLNINFFFKTIDLNKLGQGIKHADRPVMSLKNIELKTSLASGYLYYTDVNLSIKIHSPAVLTQTTITSLIFPGMPHLLEYGWNSPNEFLNDSKERLMFQVVTYSLNIDETGQIELTVQGKALNDNFNNTLVGDVGNPIESEFINDSESGGIHHNKEKIQKYIDYLKEVQKSGGQQSHDYDLTREIATSYKSIEKIARGTISAKFREKKKQLKEHAKGGTIKLHDLIHTLCDETFSAMTNAWPRVSELRFIYGDINETIRNGMVPQSLSEFPIDLDRFDKMVKRETQRGQFVMTVQRLLNLLADEFIENEDIWKDALVDRVADIYNKPEIVINFSNRNGAGDKGVMEITFHDVKNGIPATTAQLPKGKAAEATAESAVVNSSSQPLPILRVGHANSFVKNLSMSQITNSSMKAVLIERMAKDRKITARSTKVQSKAIASVPTTPLTLPLRGSLRVVGHREWKPFRALYLSSGIFLVDGVYKIMEVSHNLSADGFTTDLVLMYN